MNRYFRIDGRSKSGSVSTQYVNYNIVYPSGSGSLDPSKREIKKHTTLKTVDRISLIDGDPIRDQNGTITTVQ